MKYYLEKVETVINCLDSSADGLTDEQAQERLEKNGKNKLDETKKDGILTKIIKALLDPMIIMLIVTVIISIFVSIAQDGKDFTDAIIILAVLIINTTMSLIQENKAEKAIGLLKTMTAATSKVLRNGEQKVIKSENLVEGDVIILEAGDIVPADCRLIECHQMKVDESTLTGESVSVNKLINMLKMSENQIDIPLAERNNMVYSGSVISYGRGKAIVCRTGMDTEIGKIASSLNDIKEEATPLQRKMAELSKTLTKIVVVICVIVFIINIIRTRSFTLNSILNTTIVAVSLAVASIPEGLPAIITIILSIGVTTMSKKKALIRKLTAVETLGCVQVICTDKTGTLTKNQMTVIDKFLFNIDNKNDEKMLAKTVALCSDSTIEKFSRKAKGEPTENALVEYAVNLGLPKYELEQEQPRVDEIPFDAERKMMSTFHKNGNKFIQYTKGAPEILLTRCSRYLKDGKEYRLSEEKKQEVLNANKIFANKALRVLGAAYKNLDNIPAKLSSDEHEQDLVFIGFVGMIDPCRSEVKDAIQKCKNAGIRTIMITGDQKDTAVAIAKQLGIMEEDGAETTGSEMNGMSDAELTEVVKKCNVFARVQPEHKTRIVNCLKNLNYITAMTGDGVNDAPSIRVADVGVGMGITGTDVTKSVADVVLADDNFATIVNAIEEGRKIYDNVRKIIQFQLSTNMAEVIVVFIASLLNIRIISPSQLLWINMITDSTPGLALDMEKAEKDIMKRKPRPTNESVFSDGAGVDMIWQGIAMAIIVVISYFLGHFMESGNFELVKSQDGMTMAFLTMNLIELFEAVCMRSQRKSIFSLNSHNFYLLGAFLLTLVSTILVCYIPVLANMFELANISLKEFLLAFLLAFLIVPITEIVKLIKNKISKKYD